MGEAPGRTGEPNSSAPDPAYAVQAAIFRLAPVPHARSTLLIPPGDLLVVHGPSLPPPALREGRHRRPRRSRRRSTRRRTGGRGALESQIVLVHFTEPTRAASLDHLVGAHQ